MAGKIGPYHTGTWYLDTHGNARSDECGTDACISRGVDPTDRGIVGDWSGSGVTKIGVDRASTKQWDLGMNGHGLWAGCGTDGCIL